MNKQVLKLLKKPQFKQKSLEWFAQRQTRLTASEIASCLIQDVNICNFYNSIPGILPLKPTNKCMNPYMSKEDYIISKCESFYKQKLFLDNPATLWGKKYEDAALLLYKTKFPESRIYEFGLINHSRLKWLAASPDSITDTGIMIEIKCPYRRKIKERYIPSYYYVQMQIQMEVCNLDYCDYLECELLEFETVGDYLDYPLEKGVVVESDNSAIYPKLAYTPIELLQWEHIISSESSNPIITYYGFKKYNLIRVPRNKEFFSYIKNGLKSTHDIITKFQSDKEKFEEYRKEHYKKKYKKTTDFVDNMVCEC
jgi:putative phage-type endonuclease